MRNLLTGLALLMLFVVPAGAQEQTPIFTFDDALNTWMSGDNGLIRFDDHTLAFAPTEPFNGGAKIADQQGNVLMEADFFPDYYLTHQVFAVARIVGQAEHQLSEPGIYQVVFFVNGAPVTRMPVALRQTGAGDDPFNPQKTYAYDGYWRTFAYLTFDDFNDEKTVEINFWVGGLDLADSQKGEMFFIELIHNGEVIAHSQRTQGHIAPGHFIWQQLTLRQPHERGQEVNAPGFMLSDWVAREGRYELRFTRQNDGQMIRSYDFKVAGGEIQQHPRAALDYEPRVDFIVPRVQKRGSNTFEMLEAIWIEDRQIE